MAVMPHSVPMSSITRDHLEVKIKVTGVRVQSLRFWLAAWIFRFGAWIASVGLVIEVDPDA